MRTFSRWLPAPPRPMSRLATGMMILFLLTALALGTYVSVVGRIVAGLVLLIFVVSPFIDRERLPRLAAARKGEDICSFARGFDRRAPSFDPWTIRATWEALAPYMTLKGERIAARATDTFDKDLGIDWDDVDMSMLQEIAERAGRSLEATQSNPFYGKVSTIADFVDFLNAQPRIPRRVTAA